ncbi:DUF3127 domain-containing protein [Psychroflexus aestuariivivens]|uniref:DUF3127 domain-containing protein n=1 Tax=Psychroflexus aestuariivivens TaxID=1795040 RepID=UPI000FD9E96A|nr:DUF3127 domain-containing protein [Psychroflexus aestuariivivens]
MGIESKFTQIIEIQGTIHKIKNIQQYGEHGFYKRQLLLKVPNGNYPQIIPIDFLKDKSALLENYQEDDSIKVSVNFRGYENNGSNFVNLVGWKISD